MKGYICDICGGYAGDGPYYADDGDDDNEYCYSCCPADFHGNPYDDEADLSYSDTARGEERAAPVPASMNNPRYPPRQSAGAP